MDIKALRDELGMDRTTFAERIGIVRHYVVLMENGHKKITKPLRAKVALLRVEKALEGNDKPLADQLRAYVAEGLGA